jgi:cytochrome c
MKITKLAAASLSAIVMQIAIIDVTMADTVSDKIKVEAGEKFFNSECRRCHAVDADHASYGPPLENVIGRGAGTYPGYAYSEALKTSGIVWTPAALRAWMEDNKGFMPGTKMRHIGIADRTMQDFILSYLHSISNGGSK